jgi:hypothetical protein
MRRKARRAYKNDESGNRGNEETSEKRITQRRATTNGRPSIFEMR